MFTAEIDFILRIVEYSTGLVVGSILWSAFVHEFICVLLIECTTDACVRVDTQTFAEGSSR